MSLTFCWLGVAGIELKAGNQVLAIDPFFTRPSLLQMLRPIRPDAALAAEKLPVCDVVLVTHPHYDHLLDVHTILRRTGARAYGTPNTCVLLSALGIPAGQRTCVQVGDQFNLGPFQVTVHPARHTPIPFPRRFNGPLPAHFSAANPQAQRFARLQLPVLPPQLPVLPPRLTDYRMDACYSFLIQAEGRSLLVGNAPVPADGLFISPYHPLSYIEGVLQVVQPRRVVLIHWEDFTLPLDRPLKPMLLTPAQGLRRRFPPIQRVNLPALAQQIQRLQPGIEVEIPQLNQTVEWA